MDFRAQKIREAARHAEQRRDRETRSIRRRSIFQEVTLAEQDPTVAASHTTLSTPLVAIPTIAETSPLTSPASSPEPRTDSLTPDLSLESIDSTGISKTLTTESSISGSSNQQNAPVIIPPPRKKMTKTLPGRGAKGAPEFNGKALSLMRYWEDVEEVAESMERTTDDDKIRIALRYVSRETEVLWKGIMTPQTTTWAAFKTLIADLYPGADGSKMFTLRDLENLVTEQALIKIKTKEDFSEYHRRFKTITVHLIGASKLTSLEEQREYPKGLDQKFRDRVYQRLQIVKPDHPSTLR